MLFVLIENVEMYRIWLNLKLELKDRRHNIHQSNYYNRHKQNLYLLICNIRFYLGCNMFSKSILYQFFVSIISMKNIRKSKIIFTSCFVYTIEENFLYKIMLIIIIQHSHLNMIFSVICFHFLNLSRCIIMYNLSGNNFNMIDFLETQLEEIP